MILRPWTEADLDAWSDLCAGGNAADLVGEPGGAATSDERSRLLQAAAAWEPDGLGLLACELLRSDAAVGEFAHTGPIGTVGFTPATAALAGTFGHELKLQFLPGVWGKGYALEAASAALSWGFEGEHLRTVGAMITIGDERCANLVNRLGMQARFQTISLAHNRWCSAYLLDTELWQNRPSESEDTTASPAALRKR